MSNKALYTQPIKPFTEYSDEQIQECVALFKKMVSKHKDCQALTARNIGHNVDICYIYWKDKWILVGDLRVKEVKSSGYYTSSEGSYDVAGRFRVKRSRACDYRFVLLTESDAGAFGIEPMSGRANGNISRVLQRMCSDNSNSPIWVLGKKYLPIDPARYGLLLTKKDNTVSIASKVASFFKRNDE